MKTTTAPSSRRQQAGVTLIESAITASLAGVVVGIAAPSFEQARERQHLEGAAAQLETDILHSRGLAVLRNQGVRISFDSAGGASCYVIHTGAAGECRCAADGAAVCSGSAEALRSVRYGAETPLTLSSNSRSIVFDPVKGTVTPTATVQLQARSGVAIHQVVNVMGRVRSCTPSAALAGYRRC
ncbi:MAG: GspH/FimT family pseudopilin [Rubrivivax sp.]|nr:GspH/FimT family pseudopilin [Rubrivivax sp.]